MNPALKVQLEKLGRTLAVKNNQPVALFELPQKGSKVLVELPYEPLSGPLGPLSPFCAMN